MKTLLLDTPETAGIAAAEQAAQRITTAIDERGEAVVIFATGISQISMFEQLITADVDWRRVVMFHLDEYIGLTMSHPASFRKYLVERFILRAGPLKKVYLINGDAPYPPTECKRLNCIIRRFDIDLAMVGIGENGHLAFNDPPADFETNAPFIIVQLNDTCRRQQLREGWFPTLATVPETAITMSIRQIMKSRAIICTAPESRKATAIHAAINGPLTPDVPASILREHPDCTMILDTASASQLAQ